jgi:hypothetical protein
MALYAGGERLHVERDVRQFRHGERGSERVAERSGSSVVAGRCLVLAQTRRNAGSFSIAPWGRKPAGVGFLVAI